MRQCPAVGASWLGDQWPAAVDDAKVKLAGLPGGRGANALTSKACAGSFLWWETPAQKTSVFFAWGRKLCPFMCTVCLVHAVQKEEIAGDGLLLSAGLLES